MGVSLILLFLPISILDKGGVQLFVAVRMVDKSFELADGFCCCEAGRRGGGEVGRQNVSIGAALGGVVDCVTPALVEKVDKKG